MSPSASAGAIYLIYLGFMLLRHAGAPLPEADPAAAQAGAWQGFVKALLLQLSNPKVMVFMGSIFLSLLPAQPPAWMDAAVLAIVAINEFSWFALLALLFSGSTARAFYRRTKVWLDRIMGGALALLGLKLALRPLVVRRALDRGDAALDLGEVGRRLVDHEQRLGAAVHLQGVAALALLHLAEEGAGRTAGGGGAQPAEN